jgi:hypothetical protein
MKMKTNRLSPTALFAGFFVGFLLCSVAGRNMRQRPLYENFHHFFQLISPDSYYYPTAAQGLMLLRQMVKTNQIAVVVGGSSVLNGVGQPPDDLWSDHLQELLGENYRVVNLALRAGTPHELAGVSAEGFLPEHPRLLYVCNVSPTPGCIALDGNAYRYIFWDAYYQGMLLPSAQRDEALQALEAQKPNQRAETKMRTFLNSWFCFDDLWTATTYLWGSTVWTNLTYPDFFQARRRCRDTEPDTAHRPPPIPTDPEQQAAEAKRVRSRTPPFPQDKLPEVLRSIEAVLVPGIRQRSLAVLESDCPYYIERLTREQRENYRKNQGWNMEIYRRAGMEIIAPMNNFQIEDYVDRCHLSGRGGRRLAQAVAPRLRALARALGYEK